MLYRFMCGIAAALTLAGCANPQSHFVQQSRFVQIVHHVSLPVSSVGAISGRQQPLDFVSSLDPDCTSQGAPIITVLRAPAHGKVWSADARDFPFFHADDPRASCDIRRVSGTRLFYTSDLGYTGPDPFLISILFPMGSRRTVGYAMQVQ